MKNIKKMASQLWKDESAQGTAEYILLLVVVVAVAFLFKEKLKAMLTGKMEELGGKVSGFGSGDGG